MGELMFHVLSWAAPCCWMFVPSLSLVRVSPGRFFFVILRFDLRCATFTFALVFMGRVNAYLLCWLAWSLQEPVGSVPVPGWRTDRCLRGR